MPLQVIHAKHKTGFEESKDFPIKINSIIAGRYQILEYIGSAAFSKAVQCLDMATGELVCDVHERVHAPCKHMHSRAHVQCVNTHVPHIIIVLPFAHILIHAHNELSYNAV